MTSADLTPLPDADLAERLAAVLARAAELEAENDRLRHDDLTGFWRRGPWGVAATGALASFGSDALLLIADLDHFKRLNDTLGHTGGDIVLREQAHRLRACLGPEAVLGRLGGDGGDEFLALTRATPSPLDQLTRALARPLTIAARVVPVSASIGAVSAATLPDEPDLSRMLGAADQALYAAKCAGRGTHTTYTLPAPRHP
ncbi:diguanylate cyclase domain-containing protein [Actinoalloteichus caeruleus]|uniref:diguanylate cyclase domain-containing protein n=1 Tax=Actinoalloteichus cyanogriseus TaxID=2893586 RepID=UPI003AAE19C1